MPKACPARLEKKLYQLIISRLDGESIRSPAYQERIAGLVKKGIGGFIIFGGERDEARRFIEGLQSAADIPLFIASDIEQGVGQQISGATSFPCQMAVAAAIDRDSPGDVAILRDAIKAVAHEAVDVGINMPLIPVMDVNRNPDNPIICTRAFSDDPGEVSWFGTEYIKVLEGAGLISCAKHFPGHGDTSVDSHLLLPVITKSRRELLRDDVAPFAEAVRAGVSSIMVGHLSIPALDPRPASLSGKVIGELLRTDLDFDGLVLTDALTMNALEDFRDVAVKCIDAGADILLHPPDADLTVRELASAVRSGRLGEARIDASIDRILRVKARLGKTGGEGVDYQRHGALSARLAGMSITLLKGAPGVLPVPDGAHIVLAGEDSRCRHSLLRDHFREVSTLSDAYEALTDSHTFFGGKTVVIAVFSSVTAWRGSSGIDDGERDRIREVVGNTQRSIVVSLGSPYILRHFREADALIAAYGASAEAELAVVKCLKGEQGFKGRLPVGIEP